MKAAHSLNKVERQVYVMNGNSKPVEDAFAKWCYTLAQMSPVGVADLYDDESMLLATLDPCPITSRDGRIAYFERLMSNDHVMVDVDTQHVRMLDDSHAMVSGLYTFVITNGRETSRIPARYTFVFRRKAGDWLILEHHSSRAPSLPTN